jgi:hypothetical protein
MTHRAEECNKEYTCTLFAHLLPHAPLSLPALLRDVQVSGRPSNVRCTKTHARLPAIMRANANVDSAGVTLPAPSPTPYQGTSVVYLPFSLLLRDAQVSGRPSNVRCTKTHARLPAIMRANANVDSASVTLPAPSPTPYIRGLPWYLPESLLLGDARPARGRRSNVRQKTYTR